MNKHVVAGYGLSVGFGRDNIEVSLFDNVKIVFSYKRWKKVLEDIREPNVKQFAVDVDSIQISNDEDKYFTVDGKETIKLFLRAMRRGVYDPRK